MSEQWNIPADFAELIAKGDAQYSILGVETRDNMDSMRRFVEAVGIPADEIELDDGTQVFVRHPDPTKVITIDAGGLGDFFDSGFDVAVRERCPLELAACRLMASAAPSPRRDEPRAHDRPDGCRDPACPGVV